MYCVVRQWRIVQKPPETCWKPLESCRTPPEICRKPPWPVYITKNLPQTCLRGGYRRFPDNWWTTQYFNRKRFNQNTPQCSATLYYAMLWHTKHNLWCNYAEYYPSLLRCTFILRKKMWKYTEMNRCIVQCFYFWLSIISYT